MGGLSPLLVRVSVPRYMIIHLYSWTYKAYCLDRCDWTDIGNTTLDISPQADDDDDHDVGGDMSSGPIDFSQTCSQSSASYINDSVFDATVLQGDRLVAQPHKVQ